MPLRKVISVEDYERWIGPRGVDRLKDKAKLLQGLHVNHINSTYYGGGVATLLSSYVPLFNSLGIHTEWSVIRGRPQFFRITKEFHHAMQGGPASLPDSTKRVFEEVVRDNAICLSLDRDDIVIVHDPQPLPLITHVRKRGPWIWRCHVDVTRPTPVVWNYLKPWIEHYDAVVFSLREYRQRLRTPQRFFMPAIDPFSALNRPMSDAAARECLRRYRIPTDLPLVVQVSRYDRWKDPEGVVRAVQLAQREASCRLVLLGNSAQDDPEGEHMFESLLRYRDDRIIISDAGDDSELVNALQRKAAVVLQKSIREGFGLTVAEAMWKGTPVIGGNVGGIRRQITNGVNGFLVSSIPEAAARIVQLLKSKSLRVRMGRRAHETVKQHFLLTRYVEQYLDLFNAFEVQIRLRG
ncbi:MAG TPA: glycosyltransferase [bacterium]